MPIYEYKCMNCGSTFDALRPMNEIAKPLSCINCDSDRTVRQISVFFAKSNGKVVAGNSGGSCSGCSGGSCSSCSH